MKYSQSGAVYEGWWFDDMRNGMGKLTHPNNQVEYGLWLNDKLLNGVHAFEDGSLQYKGDWSDGTYGSGIYGDYRYPFNSHLGYTNPEDDYPPLTLDAT